LLSAFEIPSILIGDKDILNERENEIARIFKSHTLVTKERINEDTPDIFVLGEGEEGDLEDFMKAIDNNTYEEILRTVSKDYGRAASKPVIAFEFFKKVGSETPAKIEVISDLIRRIIDL